MLQSFVFIVAMFGADAEVRKIPHMDDETSLIRVKASPEDFAGKVIVICGAVTIGSYYYYFYRDTQELFYSLNFEEFGKDTASSTGQRAYLYLPKEEKAKIMAYILKAEEKQAANGTSVPLIVRVKAALRPETYAKYKEWNMFEVQDVQFISPDFKEWQWWGYTKTKDEARAQWKAEDAAKAAKEAALEAAKQAKAPKFRIWTDDTGQHKTKGKFVKFAMGKVTLELESGKTVIIPVERLSKEDQDYMKQRR